jgi:hypothetical protein
MRQRLLAALNMLALTEKQLGSLHRVSHVVRLVVYIAATPEFTEHAKVADAASELIRDVFGEETSLRACIWRRQRSTRFAGRTGSHLGSEALMQSGTRNFPEGTNLSNKTTALLPPRVNDVSRPLGAGSLSPRCAERLGMPAWTSWHVFDA